MKSETPSNLRGENTDVIVKEWAGRIDEIKFHNRVMFQEEIQAIIAADEASG